MSDGGTYLYVSHLGGAAITVLRLDPDSGALSRVQEVPAGGPEMPLAVSPCRRFLYAGVRDEADLRLASFAISARSGRLTPLGEVPAADSMTYIVTDRSGRFLLMAANPHGDRRTGTLSINPIGFEGWVQQPHTLVRTPPKLHAVLPDPANRFLLATACNGDAILRYAFDAATGAVCGDGLAPVVLHVRSGPRHLRFHPNGRFVYVVNEYDASVYAYRYDAATGGLDELQVVEAAPAGYQPTPRKHGVMSAGGADLHLTPDGRRLYVSVRGALAMAAFAIDPATGLLTSGDHYAMPSEPRGFAIDPFGRWLFAAGDKANLLAVFRIDPATGALAPAAEHPLADGPNWVECVRLG